MMRWELEIYVLSDSSVDKLLRFVSKISMARVFPPPSLQLVPSHLQVYVADLLKHHFLICVTNAEFGCSRSNHVRISRGEP